jgi:hypothetical protein
MEEWTRGEFHNGVFGGYIVYGFKYLGPNGQDGWHTTSWPNANPIHDYWVVNSIFRHISMHIFDPQFGNRNSMKSGEIAEGVDDAERQAVLDAIQHWENNDELIDRE